MCTTHRYPQERRKLCLIINLVRIKLVRIYSHVDLNTYELHGAVVDEEVLNFNAPVWPELEVSVAL